MPLLSGEGSTYPPLDVLKGVAEDLWIVDSGPLRVLGLPLPVRMTVVRLKTGAVLLHSPTRFVPALKGEIERLGPIRHLLAPNLAHWSFLQAWQRHCPEALTWAAPGLRQRAPVQASGVRLDRELTGSTPPDWGEGIVTDLVPGAAGFAEIPLFHAPSRTLVLTDLVLNLEAGKLPLLSRPLAALNGVTAPHGRAPLYLRFIVRRRRREAAAAVERMLGRRPERAIFAHGRWFERDAEASLRRSLSWLLG